MGPLLSRGKTGRSPAVVLSASHGMDRAWISAKYEPHGVSPTKTSLCRGEGEIIIDKGDDCYPFSCVYVAVFQAFYFIAEILTKVTGEEK
ncbi:hypothetical protein TNCV_2759601 [Trichonephila clavipes]|nr:hypothetical protein TNCV_2759601 [Trichonephila clavipes]